MDAYYTTPLGPFAQAIGASFGTFTSRQDVSPLPLPILPANVCKLGTAFKIEAEGEFSTTGTPTLVLGFYAGAPGASGGGTLTSILAESSAITTGSGAASWPWRLEYRGKIVTVGTAGSIVGCGNLELGTADHPLVERPTQHARAPHRGAGHPTPPGALGVRPGSGVVSPSTPLE